MQRAQKRAKFRFAAILRVALSTLVSHARNALRCLKAGKQWRSKQTRKKSVRKIQFSRTSSFVGEIDEAVRKMAQSEES